MSVNRLEVSPQFPTNQFMPESIFEIQGEFIELNKLLKVLGWVQTGGHAKIVIQDGLVLRNNAIETRVRAKLRDGDIVEFEGEKVMLQAATPTKE